ncbi:MAG: hypothetical protein OEZ36_00535 [Spirochaetota bacterium]|nr:hypothetical protein [Spirochaetota bacterium]
MKRKSFGGHFLVLTLLLFAFAYGGVRLIEWKDKKNRDQYILTQSVKLAIRSVEILNNKELSNKESALRFIYQGALDREPALSFYQIGKVQSGTFVPFLAGRQNDSLLSYVTLNELFDKNGKLKTPFIYKDNYLIYHTDLYDKTKYHGKLFIAFDKRTFTKSSSRNHVIILTFTTALLMIAFFVFGWFHRKEEIISSEIPFDQMYTDGDFHQSLADERMRVSDYYESHSHRPKENVALSSGRD